MNKQNTLPTIADLYSDNIEQVQQIEAYTLLLNKPPKDSWVKEHPYIRGYKYLPIDKVEYLLRCIFKQYKIEVTEQGTSFNGVYVTVRVHYVHPVTGEWLYHDGIGAAQLQTAKGKSPADLANINNGALSMAFPLAKTVAIKDACDHFGDLFGANLNRRDTIAYTADASIMQAVVMDWAEIAELFELKKDMIPANEYPSILRIIETKETTSKQKLIKYLQAL